MLPREAFELGYRSSSAGFFFDAMELIAAVSPSVGGFDRLRGAIELLFAQRDRVNADVDMVAGLCSRAFGHEWLPPRTVDDYRALLLTGVFEIVNRWSYIADIKQVTRLQAWFYAGFGLGRAATVYRGIEVMARLVEQVGEVAPIDQMPRNLGRMAAEASKQMLTAAEEDDLNAVRPLFEDAARRLRAAALGLQGQAREVAFRADYRTDLEFFDELARRVNLDFGTKFS